MHLMLSLSISYPYLIEFHDFVDKHPRGGCNSCSTGHDFPHNSNIYFLPWEWDPSQNVRTGPVLKLAARWELRRFSLCGSHFHWGPSIQFYWQLAYLVLTGRFSLRTELKPVPVFSKWVRTAQHWLRELDNWCCYPNLISCKRKKPTISMSVASPPSNNHHWISWLSIINDSTKITTTSTLTTHIKLQGI